MSNVNYLPVIK